MTSERRFEHDLPDLLGQLALGPAPDYRNDIVRQTARMRQRPAWTFPERLIPMTTVTSRLATGPRVPWRILALVALLLLALAVSAVLIAGARSRLPAPFGPAANGIVAYGANGDIYVADPATGAAKAVVSGPDLDDHPVWSLDGTHFAFERNAGAGIGRLHVARADGSGIVEVTTDSLYQLSSYAFSPNGREIAFVSGSEQARDLWIAKADGSGIRKLDVKRSPQWPHWMPPNGDEIIFADESGVAAGIGIYAVNVTSGVVRQIVAPTPGVSIEWLTVSPDGSHIAYDAYVPAGDRNTYVVMVAAADGSGAKALPMPPGAMFQDGGVWSNDSTRLILARGYAYRDEDMALAVVPANGSSTGVESEHRITGCCGTTYEWAPDDTTILVKPVPFQGDKPLQNLLLDPVTGKTKPAPWTSSAEPAWQRRAP